MAPGLVPRTWRVLTSTTEAGICIDDVKCKPNNKQYAVDMFSLVDWAVAKLMEMA